MDLATRRAERAVRLGLASDRDLGALDRARRIEAERVAAMTPRERVRAAWAAHLRGESCGLASHEDLVVALMWVMRDSKRPRSTLNAMIRSIEQDTGVEAPLSIRHPFARTYGEEARDRARADVATWLTACALEYSLDQAGAPLTARGVDHAARIVESACVAGEHPYEDLGCLATSVDGHLCCTLPEGHEGEHDLG